MTPVLPVELEGLPLFKGLTGPELSSLTQALSVRDVPDEARLAQEDLPSDGLVVLLHGELAVTVRGAFVTIVRPPAVLGLASLVDGGPRTASLAAHGPARVAHLPAPAFRALLEQSHGFAQNVAHALAAELRGQLKRQRQATEVLDDFFEQPNARLVPGPYGAEPFTMYLWVLRDSPARVRALLPPGVRLVPGLGGHWLLTVNLFEALVSRHERGAGRRFSYRETCPFVPCLSGLTPGLFVPELYPDNVLAILLGREIYGFPKRFGTVAQRADGVDVVVGQRLVLRAFHGEGAALSAGDFGLALGDALGLPTLPASVRALVRQVAALPIGADGSVHAPPLPVFVRKQIADPTSANELTLSIDELVQVPFALEHLSSFEQLASSAVEFLPGWGLPEGDCVAAFRLRAGFEFGAGRTVRRYGGRRR